VASPPVSISTAPSLSGLVSAPDAATQADFRLGAVDKSLLAPPCFFWESPDGECISLIGAVARCELTGPEPWTQAREWLRGAAESTKIPGRTPGQAPIAFGGFSFDGGPAAAWGLPAGVVLIPALQWHRDSEGRASLTSWGPSSRDPGSARRSAAR